MLTRIVFLIAAGLALLTLAFPGVRGMQDVAAAAVCLMAIVAAIEAGRAGRYLWVSGFIAMAVLLNPILPVEAARGPSLALVGVSLALVASWMVVLRRTIPSQTIAEVLHPRDAE